MLRAQPQRRRRARGGGRPLVQLELVIDAGKEAIAANRLEGIGRTLDTMLADKLKAAVRDVKHEDTAGGRLGLVGAHESGADDEERWR